LKALKLFPYQEEGVDHLCSSLKASYLADKPGLGKTIQSLTAAKRLGAKSILILCPASIVSQWQEHVRDWGNARVVSYDSIAIGTITEDEKDALKMHKMALKALQDKPFTYDAEWKNSVQFHSKKINSITRVMQRKEKAKALRKATRNAAPYDVIICDEAHYLKERDAHRTSYVFRPDYGLVTLGKKIMLLSGTPMLNRPAELYPVLRACYPEALHDCPNFEAYGYKFCDASWGFNGSTEFNGSSNSEELGNRLKGFMLARGLEVLGDKIPGVTYIDQPISLDHMIDDAEHVATRRRLTGEAKVDKLIVDIRSVSNNVRKLVVFYYHESVRIALQRAFPHSPLIKGGLTSFQKSQEIEKFVKLNSEVMLVQIGAGGVGLDGLQYVCNTGYIAELDWTPALEEQAVGRLRRLGQTEHVTIYRPVGTDRGIDEHIDKMNQKKSVVIQDILMHVTHNSVEKENIMSDEQVVQLLRIADALETLVVLQGGEESPAKPAKTGKKDVKETKTKKATLTHAEALALIKAEANSDPAKTEAKMTAYRQMCDDWGSKLEGVEDAEREKFTESAISIMKKAGSKPQEQEF